MRYTESALGNSYRICGIDCQPLTIGHVLLLDELGLDPIKSLPQLSMGLFIASRSFEEAARQMQSRWFTLRFTIFSMRVSLFATEEKLNLWYQYVMANSDLPKTLPTERGRAAGEAAPDSSDTPWVQHLRMYLITHLNYKPETIYSVSYQQAMWDMTSHLEYQGAVEVMDPRKWQRVKDEIEEVKKAAEKAEPKTNGKHSLDRGANGSV